jgi:hypothetical protein
MNLGLSNYEAAVNSLDRDVLEYGVGGSGIYLPTVTTNIFSPPHPATAVYHTQSHRQPVRGKDDREVKLQIQY